MVTSLTPLDSLIIIMNCTDPHHETSSKKDVGRQGGVMGSRDDIGSWEKLWEME
jgi:hypothetical protein